MSKAVQPLKSKQDIERMKNALHGRDLLLFIVGINSSLRISDILNLRVQDVSHGYIELSEQKTGKIKRIKINDAIKGAIKSLVPKDAEPSDWLFPSEKYSITNSRRSPMHRLTRSNRRYAAHRSTASIGHSCGSSP